MSLRTTTRRFSRGWQYEQSSGPGHNVTDHANMWKSGFIPKVSAELVMKANHLVGASNTRGDPTLAIVAALGDQYPPDELHAVAIRLMALSKLLKGGHADDWTLSVGSKRHVLIDQVLFEAAAQATLRATRDIPMTEITFDPDEFQRLALAAAGPAGSS
jgi:hypothetical protein